MTAPTDTQTRYRDDLLTRILAQCRDPAADILADQWVPGAPRDTWNLRGPRERIQVAALALALPEPQTSAEISCQIDALQHDGAGIIAYAREHRGWARPVLGALTDAWGTSYGARPGSITVSDLRVLVATGTAGERDRS